MILDAGALAAFADGDEALLQTRLAKAPALHLPIVALGEFRFGVLRSKHRLQLDAWITEHLAAFTVLSINEETCLHYASLCQELRAAGRHLPNHDVWIAALARQHKLPVVSQSPSFDQLAGVVRLGW